MRIYLASSWRNAEQPIVRDMLRLHGHEVYEPFHMHARSKRCREREARGGELEGPGQAAELARRPRRERP